MKTEEILIKKKTMKTRMNADETSTVNSVELKELGDAVRTVSAIRFKELGDAVLVAMAEAEKARLIYEECGMEFNESIFIGGVVLMELRRMEEDV